MVRDEIMEIRIESDRELYSVSCQTTYRVSCWSFVL